MQDYGRNVRSGIAREALILGLLVWAIGLASVLCLSAWLLPGEVRGEALAHPFYYWSMMGLFIVAINLFMPYAERRTGVKMQGPGDIRTAGDNLLFSFYAYIAWALVGLAIMLSGLAVDPTVFFIMGLTAYYLAGSAYNRRVNWGPMAKGNAFR